LEDRYGAWKWKILHPHSRGTENRIFADHQIRQQLPKGTSMNELTQKQCDWIANELNERPRKDMNFVGLSDYSLKSYHVAIHS
jgi:IS30 family transposase